MDKNNNAKWVVDVEAGAGGLFFPRLFTISPLSSTFAQKVC